MPEPVTAQDITIALLRSRHGMPHAPLPEATVHALMAALEFAASQGVAPLLADGLRRMSDKPAGWSALLPMLEAAAQSNREQQRNFRAAAMKLALLLHGEGIAHVFLKGMAFLLEDQSEGAGRGLTDIDVLVDARDLARAAELLQAHGYRLGEDLGGYDAGVHHHYPALHDDGNGIFVELHLRLMQYGRQNAIATPDIFANAQHLLVDGVTFAIPSPTQRMFHLVAHAQISNLGHVLRRIALKDAADAMTLQAAHAIDWDDLRLSMGRIGAEAELLKFLLASHRLLDLPLPYPASAFQSAGTWADAAIAGLAAPAPKLRTSWRLAAHYARFFVSDPARARLMMRTLARPARLKDLIRINRGRLGPSGN